MESGVLKVHLGVEQEFRAADKAPTCFELSDLTVMAIRPRNAGYDVIENNATKIAEHSQNFFNTGKGHYGRRYL